MDEAAYMLSWIIGAAVWYLAAMLGIALVVGTVAYCGERLRRFARFGLVLSGLDCAVTTDIGAFASAPVPTSSTDDADGDGVPDGVERVEGTDWNASTNYCCNISVTYTGIFQTTNALTFVARWGDTEVSLPSVVTTNTWTHDFGHRVAMHGERAGVHVWDDANHNGVWDEGETGDKYDFKPKGHTTCVTNELAYGHFDRNGNNLPDWWEAVTELSAGGRTVKEYEDPDEDGLINLHEFWAGTSPTVPDGSNTVLSICSRSVDERLRSCHGEGERRYLYRDYPHSASNLVLQGLLERNQTCWAHSIDFSCVSVWNTQGETQRCATVISPRHVLGAAHWHIAARQNVYFIGNDGNIYSNRIQAVKTYQYAYWNSGSEVLDIAVGLLASDLPPCVVPVSVLPTNAFDWISSGDRLPAIRLTQDRSVLVQEIQNLYPLNPNASSLVYYVDPVVNALRKMYTGTVRSGDSGSPNFLIYGDQLVLLGVTRTVSGAPSIILTQLKIQEMMDELSRDYNKPLSRLQFFDFSGCPRLERHEHD